MRLLIRVSLILAALCAALPAVAAQGGTPLFDRIERVVRTKARGWTLLDRWPNPDPQYKVIMYRWKADEKEVFAWMIEWATAEEAEREFYRTAGPEPGHPPVKLLDVGDKCYVMGMGRSSQLVFRKANLIVKLGADGSLGLDVLAWFARLIASAVPATPGDPLNAEGAEDGFTDYSRKGEAALKAGRYDEAVASFEEAVRLRPDWAEAHHGLGSAYFGSGRYKEAAEAFGRAAQLRPDFFDAHVGAGRAHRMAGQHPQSAEAYGRAVDLRPEDAAARTALGAAHAMSGRHAEALEEFKEAVRLAPENALALTGLGRSYHSLGKYMEAVDALKRALALNPDDAVTYNYLGAAYEGLGNRAEAVEALKKSISLKPDYAEAHFGLGLLYLTLGDRGAAQEQYNLLRPLSPDLAEALLRELNR